MPARSDLSEAGAVAGRIDALLESMAQRVEMLAMDQAPRPAALARLLAEDALTVAVLYGEIDRLLAGDEEF